VLKLLEELQLNLILVCLVLLSLDLAILEGCNESNGLKNDVLERISSSKHVGTGF
jgi:hypothetical protein